MGLTVDKSELKINFHKIDERYLITLFDKQNTKKEIDKIHKINYIILRSKVCKQKYKLKNNTKNDIFRPMQNTGTPEYNRLMTSH